MPDKKTTPAKVTTAKAADWSVTKHHGLVERYYLELARMSTFLLVGVMALMTFLLTVGLQHPQKPFAPIFYTTVSLLVVNLILFVITEMIAHSIWNLDEMHEKFGAAQKMLNRLRMLQQFIFVLSILSVLALIIISAHIFFAPPAAPAAGAAAGQ